MPVIPNPLASALQALQYLRKLCSHPLLVLDPSIPAHVSAVEKATGVKAGGPAAWKAIQPSIHLLHHAPKLLALQQLLQVFPIPPPPPPPHPSNNPMCLSLYPLLCCDPGMNRVLVWQGSAISVSRSHVGGHASSEIQKLGRQDRVNTWLSKWAVCAEYLQS